MDDAYRYGKEAEVAQAVLDAFSSPASPGVRAGLVAAKVEPILRQVEQDEAAAALMLILISLDDDDFGTATTSLQRALPSVLQTRSYSQRRAAKLGADLARSEAEAAATTTPTEPAAPVMTPERAEGIGITEVTGAGSAGGLAAREVAGGTAGEQGIAIDFIWVTREDSIVCPVCAPLNGKGEFAWRDRFPLGPPAHPRCRCVAEPLVRQRRRNPVESFRESFNEEDHPRGDDGRFISKGAIAAAKKDPAKADALRARVTDPEQLAKLEKELGIKAQDDHAWKAPKPGKPSNTIYDSWDLKKLIDRRSELGQDLIQLHSIGWEGTDISNRRELSGLAAEVARSNYRTLRLEMSKVESAFYYARAKYEAKKAKAEIEPPASGISPRESVKSGASIFHNSRPSINEAKH